MTTFRCFLIGGDTLLQQCGDLLRMKGHAVLGVITADARLEHWATEAGLRAIDPRGDYAAALAAQEFDFLFSAAHLQRIPARILAMPHRGAINFHDGPLPRYAGLNAPAWAIINGEKQYGVSWHRMTEAIDAGAILAHEEFPVDVDETAVSLNTKCLAAGVRCFAALIDDLAHARLAEQAQHAPARSYFAKYRRPEAAALLDWGRPAAELDALVRGLQFGAYVNPLGSPKVRHGDRFFVVADCAQVPAGGGGVAGEILSADASGICVATGNGDALQLRELRELDGRQVDTSRLGFTPGARLETPSAQFAARATEIDYLLCRSEQYWAQVLASLQPVAPPLARNRGVRNGRSKLIRRALRLPEGFGKDRAAGVHVALLAALLARTQRMREFDLGLSDSQWSAHIRGLEGLVSSEAVLRVRVSPEDRLDALAASIDSQIADIRARGTWLFDLMARQPELRAVTTKGDSGALPVGIVLGESTSAPACTPPRALTLALGDGRSAPELLADPGQLDEQALETLAVMLEGLALRAAPGNRGHTLGELRLLDEAAHQRLVNELNLTEQPLPPQLLIHDQIRAQAHRSPERIALAFEEEELSYSALEARASRLATRLRRIGAGPDKLVGVYVARSIDMVVAVLGVLMSGAAFVPLDPEFPRERIRYMIDDSGLLAILTEKALLPDLPQTGVQSLLVDRDSVAPLAGDTGVAGTPPSSSNLAYVIYTSGSTGRPKGVMIEHGNVVSFFAAMDARFGHSAPGTWLAVTSLSFDISVLELLWTLARGFKVAIQGDLQSLFAARQQSPAQPLGLSLFLWGNDDAPGRDKYRLMLEGAKYFDQNGFEAVWTPERHFHAFGGPYPNPSVTGAALAAVTERIDIRAGSCVSPLHHPVRIAEEWAVVDNLSNGRVAIAFASGWQPNDFILRPENHARNKEVMLEQIDQVRRLWRGEKVSFRNPLGQEAAVASLPRPVQPELRIWVTTAGNPDTYRQAGALGANVLTHLLGQSVQELADKIRVYREARDAAGHDPATGRVTLMLHAFVGRRDDEVREIVREPMKDYLRSSLRLVLDFAWSFPAFKRPGKGAEKPQDVDLRALSEAEVNALLDFAFERYFETSGLFGAPSTCLAMLERCRRAGVDEIACLLDFGVPTDRVLESLPLLNAVRLEDSRICAPAENRQSGGPGHSLATLVRKHGVTHLQCTPSLARMLLLDPQSRAALAGVRFMMVGGEPLPSALAAELQRAIGGELHNMYGPTETTVWSTTHRCQPGAHAISIGQALINTRTYVLDAFGDPLPPFFPGELVIGGAAVARGYLGQPAMTDERFIPDRFGAHQGGRLYRTGDLACLLPDGTLDYLGRLDQQIKIRGHRVEIEEIERLLADLPGVREAAVQAHSIQDADVRLIAYYVSAGGVPKPAVSAMREYLSQRLPEYMLPAEFMELAQLPLTPNGKVDRKALPLPHAAGAKAAGSRKPESRTERALARLWQEVLRLDEVGADDNFFELGGHSLLAMQVVSRMRQALHIDVSLRELFAAPTLARLAARIDALKGASEKATPAADLATYESHTAPADLSGQREQITI